MMAPISVEEHYYIRLTLLLNGVTTRAVRTFFDKTIPPTSLLSTLQKNTKKLDQLKSKRILNQAQYDLLFPKNGVPASITFDVTLMICLIRNLTHINPPLEGFDKLPIPSETSPESDLARIKWYRNELAHSDSITLDNVCFEIAWGDITDAVCRLGGQLFKQDCQELKVKILDSSNQELMREIKQSKKEIKELRDTIDNLGSNFGKLRDSHDNLKKNIKFAKKTKIGDSTSSAESGSSAEEVRKDRTSSPRGKSKVGQCLQSTSTTNVDEVAAGSRRSNNGVPNGRGQRYRNPAFVSDGGLSQSRESFVFCDKMRPPTNNLPSTTNVNEVAAGSRRSNNGVPNGRGQRYRNPAFVSDSGLSQSRESFVFCDKMRPPTNNLPSKKIITVVVVCLVIVGALAFGLYYKYILDDSGHTPALLTSDKCEKDVSTTTVGQRICIPYTQKFTSYPSVIHVRQLSSQYLSALKVFSVNVSSDTFVQQNGDWIVNFNPSRTDQQFRFVLEKASCDSIGIYEITIEYGDGNVTSFKIEIVLEDCVPNCKDDPQGIAYYGDKYICGIFHQCSNGDTISQTCSPETYWSQSKCACVHFDEEICDRKTKRFFQPVKFIEKCTST